MIMLQIAVEEPGLLRILDSLELNHGGVLVSDIYQIRIICPVAEVLNAQLCKSEVQPCLIEVLIVFTVLVSAEIINNYYLASRFDGVVQEVQVGFRVVHCRAPEPGNNCPDIGHDFGGRQAPVNIPILYR